MLFLVPMQQTVDINPAPSIFLSLEIVLDCSIRWKLASLKRPFSPRGMGRKSISHNGTPSRDTFTYCRLTIPEKNIVVFQFAFAERIAISLNTHCAQSYELCRRCAQTHPSCEELKKMENAVHCFLWPKVYHRTIAGGAFGPLWLRAGLETNRVSGDCQITSSLHQHRYLWLNQFCLLRVVLVADHMVTSPFIAWWRLWRRARCR